jgi:hypothetical protein
MAIFHLHVSTISRSAGRTATAAAAYRLAARIHDERTNQAHDYRRRSGVLASGIVGWKGDHSALWNAAEAAEKRSNSTVAREVLVALPAELTPEDQARLLRGFALQLRDRYGVAGSWAIHAPPAGGDERNRHGHILITTRAVDDQGRFGPKTRALDDRTTGPKEVAAIRAAWEQRVNRELARAGIASRISGRRRSIEPMEHLGPRRTAMERQGVRTRAGDRNRARAAARERAAALVREIRTLKAAEQATPTRPTPPAPAPRPPLTPTPTRPTPPALYTLNQQAAAVWSGALDVRRSVEERAARLERQVEMMNRQHGSAAVLDAIRDATPPRRDAWQVMHTIARKAAETARTTARLILDELCRFAADSDRPRYRAYR